MLHTAPLDASPQKMDVYFPDSGGPWPALVYVHGGSWMHGDKSEAVMFARGMTSQGYLVVSINYRLYTLGDLCKKLGRGKASK